MVTVNLSSRNLETIYMLMKIILVVSCYKLIPFAIKMIIMENEL